MSPFHPLLLRGPKSLVIGKFPQGRMGWGRYSTIRVNVWVALALPDLAVTTS
jgi:hypothetical protein